MVERIYYKFKDDDEKALMKEALEDMVNVQKLKSFPLINPNGYEIGKISPRYNIYYSSIEFELEDPIADSEVIKRGLFQDVRIIKPNGTKDERTGNWEIIFQA